MSVKVHLYLGLPRLTDTRDVVDIIDVKGSTVGECVEALMKDFPNVREALFGKDGKLLDRVDVWANNTCAYSDPLNWPVKDGDEIYLYASKWVIAGG